MLIARMQQELRLAALGPEHAIAGDHSIANEMRVEVLAHRGRKRVERLRLLRRALRPAQDFGVSAKLLVEENDRPGARHPIARRRINRSQRIVPVAMAIANKVRARDESRAHRLDQLVDVRRHRVGMRGLVEIVARRHAIVSSRKAKSPVASI